MSLVAIVGRPNVGKSTLFNRLVGQRKAIVDATAGTTRDRHYGKTDWNGREFSVIDTGGYSVNSDDIFEDDIRRQVMLAIEEADVILFLVEVNTGITDLDQMMADILRRTSKKVLLVCNKVDNYDLIYSSHEFYSLGLGEPYCISSMSGSGTGDLMDEIVRDLPPETKNEEEELPRITIVGRPNVGKSSLTNALLGEERNIVTPIAGTTRDAIHSRYNKYGLDFYLVDTAGMRKKGKVTEDLEFYSVMRSIRAIEESDVCILMLDAQQGLESQDLNIHNLIVLYYSLARRLSEAETEKDFLRLKKKAGGYEKVLKKLYRSLGLPEDSNAAQDILEESIIRRHYGTIVMDSEQPQGGGTSAGGMAQGIQAAPDSRKTVFRP